MADDPPPVTGQTPASQAQPPPPSSSPSTEPSTAAATSSADAADASIASPTPDAPLAPAADAVPATEPAGAPPLGDQVDIGELLKQASFDDPSAASALAGAASGAGSSGAPSDPAPPDAAPFDLPSFQQVMADAQVSSIDLLRDVELNVKIELGRSRMLVEDVLKLGEGSVVELDKLAGDPVDVFVNDRLVARGEVLVLNDNFCVRVNEIVAGIKDESR
jgi:flagellar motor switch protein FliN/FliY